MSTEELFENDYFIIIGNVSDKDKLTDTIEECGGIYSKTLNKKTNLVICNDIDDENNKKELEKVKSDIKIVTEKFVTNSFLESRRLNVEDFISKSKNGDADTTNSKSVLGKRNKRESDGIEIDKQWIGTLFYTTTQDAYPFVCNILKRDDDEKEGKSTIQGTFKWINLNDAETAFTAEIEGDTIKINEHTLLTKDNDQVELPNKYEAKIVQGLKLQIKGSIVYDDPEDQKNEDLKNTFSLTLNGPIPNNNNNNTSATTSTSAPMSVDTAKPVSTPKPPLDLDYLVDGASFDGDYETPYKFSLKVTSRKNEKDIEGIVEWVDLKTKTKFKGTLEKDMTVTITENEIISGDGIDLPIIYKGKLTSTNNSNDMDLISGDYSVNTTPTGTFTLELIV
ncbi:hypothetical protein DICPUDRAFT_36115 [Dictyostelium purpureum]|uniref:BRCT domain-containing protein n=1 Tax=Dictyostelium purpureum TaxID=5786 RepID=F0ZQF6_DICPU|nr:uncharacterized protein DICPUDRAFT_36115 [Dictyostelium purpureum]EGC33830.1 hypothetical protein DICPUDRAFT_36115 [Dictyostelium purpureum]|eukprot:XP_003289656.1 hypothetical protein DICPUDRAFT_36115 [Dictyostelium purpureum]